MEPNPALSKRPNHRNESKQHPKISAARIDIDIWPSKKSQINPFHPYSIILDNASFPHQRLPPSSFVQPATPFHPTRPFLLQLAYVFAFLNITPHVLKQHYLQSLRICLQISALVTCYRRQFLFADQILVVLAERISSFDRFITEYFQRFVALQIKLLKMVPLLPNLRKCCIPIEVGMLSAFSLGEGLLKSFAVIFERREQRGWILFVGESILPATGYADCTLVLKHHN